MAPSTPCPDTGRGCLQPRGEGTGSIAHPWWDLERATSPLRPQLPLCRMCLGDPCPAGPPVQVFCSCVCPFSGTLSPLASKALSFSGFQLGPSLESCRELVKGSLSTRRHFHSRLGRGADTGSVSAHVSTVQAGLRTQLSAGLNFHSSVPTLGSVTWVWGQ